MSYQADSSFDSWHDGLGVSSGQGGCLRWLFIIIKSLHRWHKTIGYDTETTLRLSFYSFTPVML